MSDKPYSPACERNRDTILDVLRVHFAARRRVLEIGSGSGQHAAYFAAAMPWLAWQCSDRAEYLPGIATWLDEANLHNTPVPIALDVDAFVLPADHVYDAVFSANTLHIMSWQQVVKLFDAVGVLAHTHDMTLVVYGPFNYGGGYTSASNAAFDAWLKARDPLSGVRDLEAVDLLANGIGLRLVADMDMPANNRCIVWSRSG